MEQIPLTIHQAAAWLRERRCTSAELLEACTRRADALDGCLGTYVTRFSETAHAAACRADRELANGLDRGPLHGIPIAIKDLLETVEGPTTAQSMALAPRWDAAEEGTAIARLRAAGTVVTGKTTTMEFGAGFPDPTKPFPLPRNPRHLDAWTGGSSSGSSNGVSAGLFLGAVGTDSGGSIRMPAAFCGISGLKPTFGLVPKTRVVPSAFSLDHVGPLARSAWDCAAMLEVMAGHDPRDRSSVARAPLRSTEELSRVDRLDGVRVGVLREHHFVAGFDPAAIDAIDEAERVLADLGATVVDVTIPLYEEVTAATLLIGWCEQYAYHRRNMQQRWADYFATSRTFIPLAAFTTGADYVQAQRVRRAGQHALAQVFHDVAVVVAPTATVGAPTYQAVDEHGFLAAMMGRVFTLYWDGVGNPALALPAGATSTGMPLGVQVAGRPFEEASILCVGHAFQQVTDWHLRLPPVVGQQDLRPSYTPKAEVPQGNEKVDPEVRRLLDAEGLPPSEPELAALSSLLPRVRAMVETLYSLDESADSEPAMVFEAAPYGDSGRSPEFRG